MQLWTVWLDTLRGALHRQRLARARPELEALRERFGHDREQLAKRSMDVYRRNGIAFVTAQSAFEFHSW